MPLKTRKNPAEQTEKFKAHLRETQECLRGIVQHIEGEFFDRIKNWKTKNVKKLYNDYSMYVVMEDLLQVVEKASQRM